MSFSLEKKVAIITGGGSGIGRGCAILFSRLGAKLAIVGRNEDNLKSVKAECTKENSSNETLIIRADLTNEEDCKRVVIDTVAHFKKLDILVNNAGTLKFGSIKTTSLQQYDTVMNLNVRSLYHLTMLCTPHLIHSKGNIVNVSSIVGTRSFPGILAYSTSKSAVDQITKCVSLELANKGVRVNSVNPGVIKTDFQKKSGLSDEKYQKYLEHSTKTHPLGRPGEVEEVANTIAFLASDQASFITGENLHVDGGKHVACL